MTTYHNFPFSIKSLNEDGTFAGYASVFNILDNQNDIIVPGAFSQTISGREGEIKLLWQHKLDEPIGVFSALVEDEHGLFVEGKLLLDVQRAQEAYVLLKRGALKGMSIGYSVKRSGVEKARNVRIIQQVDLWEISLVTFPANEAATVTFVKEGLPQNNVREFERFLRASGYTRTQAKAIASRGYKAVEASGYEDKDMVGLAELGQSVERALALLL